LPEGFPVSPVEYRTAAIDGKTGDVLWSNTFSHEGAQLAHTQLVDLSAEGDRLFVSAFSQYPEDEPNPGTSVVAYDTESGTTLWMQVYPGLAQAIAADPQADRVYVAGAGTIAFDALSGDELWAYPKSVFALAVDPSGRRVYLMGYRTGGGPDTRTAALVAGTGRLVWATRSQTATNVSGAWISVSSDKRVVFEAGSLSFPTHSSNRFAVGAYSSRTGERSWKEAYGESERDQFPAAFDISPNGRLIFVAGRIGYQRAAEFLTVAFSTP
jgi:outer membrane protein assembly factor BamB